MVIEQQVDNGARALSGMGRMGRAPQQGLRTANPAPASTRNGQIFDLATLGQLRGQTRARTIARISSEHTYNS